MNEKKKNCNLLFVRMKSRLTPPQYAYNNKKKVVIRF